MQGARNPLRTVAIAPEVRGSAVICGGFPALPASEYFSPKRARGQAFSLIKKIAPERPFLALQRRQSTTTSASVRSARPFERGSRWSAVRSALVPQTEHHGWHCLAAGRAAARLRRSHVPGRRSPQTGQASPKYLWPLLQSTTLPMLPTKAEVLGARDGDALPLPPSTQPTRVVAMAPVRPAARDRPTASAAHARMPIHDLAAQLRLEFGPAVGTQDRAGAQPFPP